jgi:hypothetical protein
VNFSQLKVPDVLLSTGLVAGALLGSAAIALTQPARPAPGGQPPAGQAPAGQPQKPSNSSSPSGWQNFRSPEGRFAVVLPSTPTKKSSEVVQAFWAESTQGFYAVMYGDSPSVVEAKQAYLDLPKEFVKAMKGTIVSQRNISLQRNPGKEFQFEVVEDGVTVTGKGRVYQVGKRVYVLLAAAPDQESGKFFNSFGLL